MAEVFLIANLNLKSDHLVKVQLISLTKTTNLLDLSLNQHCRQLIALA